VGIAHGGFTRRPPIALDTMVPRTGGYTRRWGLGFVHHSRAIFCRAVPNLSVTIRNFCIAVTHRGVALLLHEGDELHSQYHMVMWAV
jgi:hypothetical protein